MKKSMSKIPMFGLTTPDMGGIRTGAGWQPPGNTPVRSPGRRGPVDDCRRAATQKWSPVGRTGFMLVLVSGVKMFTQRVYAI